MTQSTVVDLMSRRYLQEALFDSENNLRKIVENSIDGVVMVDREGYIIMWNPGQERITGVSAGVALGKQVWDIIWALTPARRRNEEFHERLRQRLRNAIQMDDGASFAPAFEIEIERPSGELRVIQQFTFVMPTADGPRLGCVFHDVTEFRLAARNLLQRNAELSLLNRINGVLASHLDLEQVRKTVLKEVVQLLHVNMASIWLTDETNSELVCVQSLDQTGEPVPDSTLLQWRPLAESVARNGRSLVTQDTAVEARVPAEVALDGCQGAHASECVLIQFRDKVLGVLLLVYEHPKYVSEADVNILESIAAATAAAIENVRLHQKAQELALLQERQRLAGSLHDAINQSLFSYQESSSSKKVKRRRPSFNVGPDHPVWLLLNSS
jgi:PAS domain S-box-containing protein